jgi:hypothetical protein
MAPSEGKELEVEAALIVSDTDQGFNSTAGLA